MYYVATRRTFVVESFRWAGCLARWPPPGGPHHDRCSTAWATVVAGTAKRRPSGETAARPGRSHHKGSDGLPRKRIPPDRVSFGVNREQPRAIRPEVEQENRFLCGHPTPAAGGVRHRTTHRFFHSHFRLRAESRLVNRRPYKRSCPARGAARFLQTVARSNRLTVLATGAANTRLSGAKAG